MPLSAVAPPAHWCAIHQTAMRAHAMLTGVKNIDLPVTVMGQKFDMPTYCSPTALQRLFHTPLMDWMMPKNGRTVGWSVLFKRHYEC